MAGVIGAVKKASFKQPAEWAKHMQTILAWPSPNGYFAKDRGSWARATSDVTRIAEAVSRFEPVTLLVDQDRLEVAKREIGSWSTSHPIRIHSIQGRDLDLWMRDIAPTYVVKKCYGEADQVCGVDFNFNGWGNRFPTPTTTQLAHTLLGDTQTERIVSSIVTEGGAIEVDGEGTLLATESSILNENRNPGMERGQIENELKRTLGVEKIIWIPGIGGQDATDCHIDALARFVRPGMVVMSKPDSSDTPEWIRVYDEARRILSEAVDARGRVLKVAEIEEASLSSVDPDHDMTEDVEDDWEDPWHPAFNYVNFLRVNGGVLVPQFGDIVRDAKAVEVFRSLFHPEREVIPVALDELPFLGGGIHCSAQQIPFP